MTEEERTAEISDSFFLLRKHENVNKIRSFNPQPSDTNIGSYIAERAFNVTFLLFFSSSLHLKNVQITNPLEKVDQKKEILFEFLN